MIRRKSLAKALAITLSVSMLGTSLPGSVSVAAENEEAEDVPKWMTPVKTSLGFLDMDAGDGRNNALFSYILTLQSNDFSVEEARETIAHALKDIFEEELS